MQTRVLSHEMSQVPEWHEQDQEPACAQQQPRRKKPRFLEPRTAREITRLAKQRCNTHGMYELIPDSLIWILREEFLPKQFGKLNYAMFTQSSDTLPSRVWRPELISGNLNLFDAPLRICTAKSALYNIPPDAEVIDVFPAKAL
jgi:hypothetical protein